VNERDLGRAPSVESWRQHVLRREPLGADVLAVLEDVLVRDCCGVGRDRTKRELPSKRVLLGGVEVDIRLPGKGNSNPVAQGRSSRIISMIKWTRTSRLSIKISLSGVEELGARRRRLTPGCFKAGKITHLSLPGPPRAGLGGQRANLVRPDAVAVVVALCD
jgi:hypothetical protein